MVALAEEVLGLAVVELVVTGNDGDDGIPIGVDERERLTGAAFGELEERRDLGDRSKAGSMDLLQGSVAGALANRDLGGGRLVVSCVTARVAVDERGLAGVGEGHELDGGVSTDLTRISDDGQGLEAAALADIRVRLLHIVVGLLQRLLRRVEGVTILHDELAAAHEAEARAHLIAELILDLIQVDGELLVALELVFDEVGNGLLMGGSENELVVMAIGEAHELGSVDAIATGIPPHLGIDHDGHEQLLGAGGVHLVAYDVFDLAQRAPGKRKVAIQTSGLLANHARAKHQAMAGELGLSRILLQRRSVEVRHLHGARLRHRRPPY